MNCPYCLTPAKEVRGTINGIAPVKGVGCEFCDPDTEPLRLAITGYPFLWIVEEASPTDEPFTGFMVVDSRCGNLGTVINSLTSLDYLVENGAEAWLNSHFNGMGK